jgi:hypothetical protein
LAQGDYLLLLSADDFLLPGAIERAVAVLDRQPEVGLVLGAWLLYRAGDALEGAPPGNGGATLLDPVAFIDCLAVENSVATATAVVRTSVQRELGGYLLDLPHSGDLEMWLRFALHSRIAYVDKLQAAYRRHEGNMSLRYAGLPDFQQRKIAFMMHLGEIRRRLHNGAVLEIRIRRRLLSRALILAALALRDRQVANLSPLLAFSLLNGLACLGLMLRQGSGFLRQA